MSNKSDYNKPRTNIFDLLPEVLQSETNKSVLENSFNRFLTKAETKHVNGFIGVGNPNATVNRQIVEPTPDRQAYQLQPILYTKIGTIEHMATYKDILNELVRLGVDTDRLDTWGKTLEFNWIPPIDIDKLLHYIDYYWYDEANPTSQPEYITIKNIGSTASAKAELYSRTLDEYGETLTIVALDAADQTISVQGNSLELFAAGLPFYTTSSTNPDLNLRYWTTVSAEFDDINNRTVITVEETFTNDIDADGTLSLKQLLYVLEAGRDCIVNGSLSYTGGPWMDNQVGTVIWNYSFMTNISQETQADWVVVNGSPVLYDIWYDTTNDQLKQYNGAVFVAVQYNFSVIVSQASGNIFFDPSQGCGHPTNDWVEANKWMHKSVVPNFSIAKRAQIPIIEYNPLLEMNEWIFTDHVWKYRSTQFESFSSTAEKPSLFELIEYITVDPISTSTSIVLEEGFGDLTDTFVPGYSFSIKNGSSTEDVTVKWSTFGDEGGTYYQTRIELESAAALTALEIVPLTTSQGDSWEGYNIHWVYVEASDSVPVNHQPLNPFIDSSYSQDFTVAVATDTFVLSASLQTISLTGANDIRVYIDGVRQYGTYTETDSGGYVAGIVTNSVQSIGTVVRIEVGAATSTDIGFEAVTVRAQENDTEWSSTPTPLTLSLINYRKVEQLKTRLNQYPLFDMYNIDGTSAYKATKLFGFRESTDYPVNSDIGKRIVRIDSGREYEFEQFLVDEDSGPMYVYRDYSITHEDYWYDTDIDIPFVWDGTTWDPRYSVGTYYIRPVVSGTQPGNPWDTISGALWFDSLDNTINQRANFVIAAVTTVLKISGDVTSSFYVGQTFHVEGISKLFTVQSVTYDGSTYTEIVPEEGVTGVSATDVIRWTEVSPVAIRRGDPTLQSIWKKGLNDEEYIPSYVNGDREEVPVGDSTGDWEIPNQLYYNNLHENRKILKLSELLTHFNTVIDSQTLPVGFVGGTRQLFHLLFDVNYGVGGTIKEHNDSYDTFLSSVYIDSVTPIGIIEFAQDQYDSALNTLKGTFTRNVVGYLTDVTTDGIVNLVSNAAEEIITTYEQNDATSLIYGDSQTFDQTTGDGIRNWIQTLPFMQLAPKYQPSLSYDDVLGINEVIHHDGHRAQYSLLSAVNEQTIQRVITTVDARAGSGGTLGKQSTSAPPTTTTALLTEMGATQLLAGTYWYQVYGGTRTLSRFNVARVGTLSPGGVPEGTLWYDTGTDLLKELVGTSWVAVTGIFGDITDAWKVIDVNKFLAEVILEAETRLYNAAPDFEEYAFDFTLLESEPTLRSQYDEEAFGDYINERDIQTPYSTIGIYEQTNPFTWNYVYSLVPDYPKSTNLGTEIGGTWQDLYEKIYGTPYPHLEPWKLQGYEGKPDWWDEEYADTTGTRRWAYTHSTTTGMWENIRTGVVPSGRLAPDGVTVGTGAVLAELPTYTFFSVNIDDTTIDGYDPDDLFPPYWDYVSQGGSAVVRSLFYDLGTQVSNTSLDYLFEDAGIEEWNWRVSSQKLYDDLKVAFRMQPTTLIQSTFGPDFIEVAGLKIEDSTERVYSHKDVIFHGDVVDSTSIHTSAGLNQWYVNFNRYSGFDISSSDFRKLWKNWTTPLGYQFASFVDAPTFIIDNDTFEVSTRDYAITLKKSPGISDYWVDSLNVSVFHIPSTLVQYNTEGEWRFGVSTASPISRNLTYYGVRNYKFGVDTGTNICTLYQFNITDVDLVNNLFVVDGNQTEIFSNGDSFTVTGSTGNDGTYTVSSSVYLTSTNTTSIKVSTSIPDGTVDGVITTPYRSIPWDTGTKVQVASTKYLPAPLVEDTNYYIIKHDSYTFELAETEADAITGTAIALTSQGSGDVQVGEVLTDFSILGGSTTSQKWKHYVLDKTFTRSALPPVDVNGIQNIVNLVDGFAAYAQDTGFTFNLESNQRDPVTNNVDDWQYETERFINWLIGLQKVKFSGNDSFDVVADETLDQFTFSTYNASWGTGTKVTFTTTGTMPSPLLANTPYYLIRDDSDASIFRIATTKSNAKNNIYVDLLSAGTGQLVIQEYVSRDRTPQFELNPFRNALWFSNEQGIVANILTGPYKDIRTEQTIYDQYGRLIDSSYINILRQDKQTQIRVQDEIPNDLVPRLSGYEDPYSYIHLGGIHLFLDGYEHVILFDDYSVDDYLIYDSFIGLNTPKFYLQFDGQPEFTLRPNVGGYFLSDNNLVRNFEASVEDLRKAYDTFTTSEANSMTSYARDALGYDGPKDYLNELNINPKSQFIFWRGMIQSKGSTNSIKAFINSRRFVDASLDEFWAYKIAEYGDAREKKYPELNLFASDSAQNDLKLQFATVGDTIDTGFEGVTIDSQDRWFEFPNQRTELELLDPMYFDAGVTSVYSIIDQPIVNIAMVSGAGTNYFEIDGDYSEEFFPTGSFNVHGSTGNDGTYTVVTSTYISGTNRTKLVVAEAISSGVVDGQIITDYFVLKTPADGVEITYYDKSVNKDPANPRQSLTEGLDYDVVNSRVVTFTVAIAYQVVDVGGAQVGGNSTGLANDATVYTADVYVDGSSTPISVTVTGSLAQTYTDLLNEINTDLGVSATATLSSGNIKIESATTGPGSAIEILDTDLFSSLTTFNQINTSAKVIGSLSDVKIYITNVAKPQLNPGKIIDYVAGAVINEVPVWDPARGHHYHNAIHLVDLQRDADPSVYTTAQDTALVDTNFWTKENVGTTWLDTSDIDYVPYYDSKVNTDFDDRIHSWGLLAEWADVTINQWTESDVPPDEWDALALVEEGDSSIPESERKTGIARSTLVKDVNGTWTTVPSDPLRLFQALIPFGPTVYVPSLMVDYGDIVDVYVNGIWTEELTVSDNLFTITNTNPDDDSGYQYVNYGGTLTSSGSTGLTADNTAGYQIVDVGGSRVGGSATGLTPSTTYQVIVTIDGTPIEVFVNSDFATTYSELINEINTDLGGTFVALDSGNIKITSQTTGPNSSVIISSDSLFDSLTDYVAINSPVAGSTVTTYTATITVDGTPIAIDIDGDDAQTVTELLTELNSTLGTAATATLSGGNIKITSSTTGSTSSVSVSDVDLFSSVTGYSSLFASIVGQSNYFTVAGDLTTKLGIGVAFNVVESASGTNDQSFTIVSTGSIFDGVNTLVPVEETIPDNTVPYGSIVDPTVPPYVVLSVYDTVDTIDIVRRDPTQDQLDKGLYVFDYPHTEVVSIADNGVDEITTYYFWVGNKKVRQTGQALSLYEAEQELIEIPIPYMIPQKTTTAGALDPYRKLVVHGLLQMISADDRFKLRFTRDFTLRDSLYGDSALDLKSVHQEWEIFRQNQQYNIPRDLWDKATEAMMGETIASGSRVPTLERELYDNLNGTDTRFGLGDGQAFVDKDLAIATVLYDLQDPNNDFYPIDIASFFDLHSFDTAANVQSAMDTIYNTFTYEHVNRIFFALLHDAFSTKGKYPGIFKTSMVALHGIKVLETSGLYDD